MISITLYYIYHFSNPNIPYSFNMVKLFNNTFNHLLCTSRQLSYLIPNKHLRLSFHTALILNLSFSPNTIVSLPYNITDMSNVSCSYLAHSSNKLLAFTRELREHLSFLLLTTNLKLAPFVSDSSKTHHKYLNLDTCSNNILCTRALHIGPSSPHNTFTLLLCVSSYCHK